MSSPRTKAKTFYGAQELQEMVNSKRSKMENENFDSTFPGRRADRYSGQQHRFTSFRDTFRGEKKQYNVKENNIKGVYV